MQMHPAPALGRATEAKGSKVSLSLLLQSEQVLRLLGANTDHDLPESRSA